MPARKAWIAGVVAVTFWPMGVQAQIPGLPSGAGAFSPSAGTSALGGLGGSGAAAVPSTSSAAQPSSIWSSLGLSSSNLQACQAKICASPFGQMLNSLGTGPVAGMTGGFLPSLCPPAPNASQIAGLQQQPGGASAAAAQIQASEANAKARVAAVEYLGTVDCSRWPEAKKALIYSLREDPNECVRFAAARALNSGCCCNQEVIEALRTCVSGEAKGNEPPETSFRVKASAFSALQNCLLRVPEVLPPEVPPEASPAPDPSNLPVPPERATQNSVENLHMTTSYSGARRNSPSLGDPHSRKTFAQTVDDARRTLFEVSRSSRPPAVLPTGRRSLLDVMAKAREEVNTTNTRHARNQGDVQQSKPKIDNGAQPTSYALAAAPDQADLRAKSGNRPGASSSDDDAGTAPSAERGSNAHRGLIGILFQSSDH
jgi:hypothetical protein